MTPSESQRLEELARKWVEGSITPDEQEEFARWYNRDQDVPASIPLSSANSEEAHREQILANIRLRADPPGKYVRWRNPAIAAATVLLALALAGYFRFERPKTGPAATTSETVAGDVLPGGDRATLTLHDGRTLLLESQQNGVLKNEPGVRISKEGGMLIYEALAGKQENISFNTIRTPRGGQYSLRLPDGSTVWLNSESSLRYPTRFTGQSRKVELTGEAYFDIVPSQDERGGKQKPFVVAVDHKQTVKVLGTQFNISGYEDENIVKTTLVKGSVEVLGAGGGSALLKPNQQSALSANGKLSVTDRVNIEEALAWKNGQILFTDTDIKEIMRQISRWYDVDVVYLEEIPKRLFNGGISRSSKLSSVLQILESSDVHFSVEGKRIIVTK